MALEFKDMLDPQLDEIFKLAHELIDRTLGFCGEYPENEVIANKLRRAIKKYMKKETK